MSVLIVAQLRFKDHERYNAYQAKFPRIFGRFRGKLIAADNAPQLLEGQNPPDKVVILQFPDETTASEFQNDPEYQEISVDRKAGADALVLQIRGFS